MCSPEDDTRKRLGPASAVEASVTLLVPLCYCVAVSRADAFHSPYLMATCPRCKGHLTDNHRCPRRPTIVAAKMIGWAVVGGLSGWLLVLVFNPWTEMPDVEVISAIAGALIAVGINRALNG